MTNFKKGWSELDKMFSDLFGTYDDPMMYRWTYRTKEESDGVPRVRTTINRTDTGFTVDLPGVKKKDIQLFTIADNAVLSWTRGDISQSTSIHIDTPIKQARLEDGVLTVTLSREKQERHYVTIE